MSYISYQSEYNGTKSFIFRPFKECMLTLSPPQMNISSGYQHKKSWRPESCPFQYVSVRIFPLFRAHRIEARGLAGEFFSTLGGDWKLGLVICM